VLLQQDQTLPTDRPPLRKDRLIVQNFPRHRLRNGLDRSMMTPPKASSSQLWPSSLPRLTTRPCFPIRSTAQLIRRCLGRPRSPLQSTASAIGRYRVLVGRRVSLFVSHLPAA
jgi:hypothetical protein